MKKIFVALLLIAGGGIFLCGIVIPLLERQQREEAFQVATRTQIEAFKPCLAAFEKDCGRLPSSEEGLGALVQKAANVPDSQWHGPYLDFVPKDPWGHDYVYCCPGRHGTNRFEIYSNGPDGVSRSGGEDPDDIASWRALGAQ